MEQFLPVLSWNRKVALGLWRSFLHLSSHLSAWGTASRAGRVLFQQVVKCHLYLTEWSLKWWWEVRNSCFIHSHGQTPAGLVGATHSLVLLTEGPVGHEHTSRQSANFWGVFLYTKCFQILLQIWGVRGTLLPAAPSNSISTESCAWISKGAKLRKEQGKEKQVKISVRGEAANGEWEMRCGWPSRDRWAGENGIRLKAAGNWEKENSLTGRGWSGKDAQVEIT